MSVLSFKGLLAIAAVVDVALHAQNRPISAKTLAALHNLPPRHLEPVLQALVHQGILRGVRGPRGGYELGRDQRRISADAILRAAGTVEDAAAPPSASALLTSVVLPAIAEAEMAFSAALQRITLDEVVQRAEKLRGQQKE